MLQVPAIPLSHGKEKFMLIEAPCVFTLQVHRVLLSAEQYDRIAAGEWPQFVCLRTHGRPDIEFLLTGISPSGWEETYGSEESPSEPPGDLFPGK